MTITQNKEYMFVNSFDAFIYLCVSCIYPALSYGIQLKAADPKSAKSIHEIMIAGLFFCAVYFYDFYAKYESCDGKKPWIINCLLCAKLIFGAISCAILTDIFIVFWNNAYWAPNLFIFKMIPLLAGIPFMFAIIELCRRTEASRKGKINGTNVNESKRSWI